MSKDNGGPAFPNESALYTEQRLGMTLRDYFAAIALQTLRADEYHTALVCLASDAYRIADAMLAERAK